MARNESFEMGVIKRSDIQFSEYNPRYIEDKNMETLKKGIKKNGLVMPVVVNKRTMRVVNGHQRIKALDSMSRGNKDYEMTVAFIDVDDKQEKEINVLLNNTNAMGDYDYEKLGALYKEGLDVENMGFTATDILEFFGNDAVELELAEINEMAERLADMKDADGKMAKKSEDIGTSEYDFYSVVVFKDPAHRKTFNDMLGIEDKTFIDGAYVLGCFKDKVGK